MQDLVTENENLIYHVLKKMKMYHLHEDYYDIGAIGLVKARNTYTPEKGAFTTYAYKCIANEIKIEIRKNNSTRRKATVVSLDKTMNEDEMTLKDLIPSNDDVEENAIRQEQIEKMNQALLRLTMREQEIIKAYYYEEQTQTEIAERLNSTQTSIHREIKKILNKLKHEMGE